MTRPSRRPLAFAMLVGAGALAALALAWRGLVPPAPLEPGVHAAAPSAPSGDPVDAGETRTAIEAGSREVELEPPAERVIAAIARITLARPRRSSLPPPRLRVDVVTPEGEPFEETLDPEWKSLWRPTVLVTAEATVGPFLPPVSARDALAGGKFLRRHDRPAGCIGELELRAELPAHLTLAVGRAWLACEPIFAGTEIVRFVLDPARCATERSGIRLRVLDRATSAPIEGASATLNARLGETVTGTLDFSERDGTVRIEPWPAGLWTLRVQARGYAEVRREIVLRRGEQETLGDVWLEPAAPVRVRLIGQAKDDHVVVEFRKLDAERRPELEQVGTSPPRDDDGAYEVYPGAGEYVVSATLAGNSLRRVRSPSAVVTRALSGTTLELELHETVPVVLRPSASRDARTIEIRDALGIPAVEPWKLGATSLDLLPGSYTVRLHEADGSLEERSIVVDETTREIELP